MQRRKFISGAALALTAASCSTMPTPGQLLGGATAAVTAPTVRAEVLMYLPADKLQMIQADLQFFEQVYLFMKDIDMDITYSDLFTRYPDAVSRLEPAYEHIVAVMEQEAEESGRTLPLLYSQFTTTVPPLWNAVKANERAVKALEIFNAIRPLAILVTA